MGVANFGADAQAWAFLRGTVRIWSKIGAGSSANEPLTRPGRGPIISRKMKMTFNFNFCIKP